MAPKILSTFIALCLKTILFAQQDSVTVKTLNCGSRLIVPAHQTWKIKQVLVSDNSGFSFKVNPANFKQVYNSGDTIKYPFYIAEMEFLSNKNMAYLQVYYIEKKGN